MNFKPNDDYFHDDDDDDDMPNDDYFLTLPQVITGTRRMNANS